jgi:CheY-like chemotaxis protein
MIEQEKIKILCVEDEQEIRSNIVEILKDEGFEVFEAQNGKYGFTSFIQNNPDLIISDIMMPEVDGYGLLSMIRETKNSKNNQVPFIFLSALGQKEDVIKGIDLSANDYMIKPIDFDLLIAKIKEKALNATKLKENHHRNIQNLKDQFSFILPSEVAAYLDLITRISEVLKNEPYGPFCHRRYIEDIDKIYINSIKLRTAIVNALDPSTIDHKLNVEEEVATASNFLEDFINNLSDKFKNKVSFEHLSIEHEITKIRIDRAVISEALKKILVGIFKSDQDGELKISIIVDHLKKMLFIFSFKSNQLDKHQLLSQIDEEQISKILDKQNCTFELVDGKERTAMLIIPNYRVIH